MQHKYRLFNVLCWLWNLYEGIFINKNKQLYKLFSPDPAVFCVDFAHYVAF